MRAEGPVLVLGATSLVGRFLLPRLQAEGAPFVALSRDPPVGAGGRWLKADLSDPELVARLPAASAVLSLSPIWLLPSALPALAQTGAKRLVAFSSTSRWTKADSADAGERAVAARLVRGEEETERFCAAAGIAWTVLRPTMIYAEGLDQNVSRLAGLIRRLGFLPLAGAGGGLRQPVHADDLAWAALAVLDAPATYHLTYDLPGGETLTYRQMVERIFDGLGRKPRILPVPPPLWRLGLGLAGPLLPGATAAMGERMAADLAFDSGPARRDFGWSPRAFRPRF
jgi:nucleoside-diphosphate-sugar epimerase